MPTICPMRAYVDGLKHAERERELFPDGLPDDGDPVAHAYARGFFAALEEVRAKLVGHVDASREATLWRIVNDVDASAAYGVRLQTSDTLLTKKG